MISTFAGPAGHLHVDDGGAGGIPVVFAHSYAGSSAHWKSQLGHLRATRRALALDLRGHGRSDPPGPEGWAVDSLAADIAAVVDAAGLDRFVLVGHSMGGAAALEYARRHPERVAGLVLNGTPGRTPREQAHQVMAAMEADFEGVNEGYWQKLLGDARPEVNALVRHDMQRLPRDASMAIFRALFDYDPAPALAAYRGPILIVDTPHSSGPGSLHELAPDAERRVIEGTSHWSHLDKPAEFNRILDEFLAKVE